MSTAVNKEAAFVEFHEYHQPTLADGDYAIEVTQQVEIAGHTADVIGPFITSRHFTVAGERFELKPTDVEAVFPPDGNLGDHSNVLPHVVLNRSTLPWERTVNGEQASGIPWLALLVFDEEEKPELKKLTVADLLLTPPPGAPKFPKIKMESWQQPDDALTVIDVPYSLLSQIMPAAKELKLLTHVRFGKGGTNRNNAEENADDTPMPEELAIVMANRLPQRDKTSTAHLVSLENRFRQSAPGEYEFDYQGATSHGFIRLVSLKSWSFTCESRNKSFTQLLCGLNNKPSTLRLPDDTTTAKKFFSEGYVAVPHYFRSGDQNLAWFRGPLVPGRACEPPQIELPVRTADALVRYDTEFSMFDVSYAAAWELGRLLALEDKDFSTGLYQWRRQEAQRVARNGQRLLYAHLPQPSATEFSVPKEISTWLESLRKLEGVPFNYLVADERMLPPESIRFFRVDPNWISCLADGAFSIGRVSSSDHKADVLLGKKSPAANSAPMLTGFLLRSEVVSGWPGLVVDVFTDKEGKNGLTRWRMDRLAPGVLLCLFAGAHELARVEIYEKPEMLHFGFSADADDSQRGFYKKLRDREGKIQEKTTVDLGNQWHSTERRTINVEGFGKSIVQKFTPALPLTSAEFGLQMIESGHKIIFQAG